MLVRYYNWIKKINLDAFLCSQVPFGRIFKYKIQKTYIKLVYNFKRNSYLIHFVRKESNIEI